MTVSSFDRFSKGLLATTKFQEDEKKVKNHRDFAKLENIRKYQKNLFDKVENEKTKNLERENGKMKTMGLAQWSYEHVNIFMMDFKFKFIIFRDAI